MSYIQLKYVIEQAVVTLRLNQMQARIVVLGKISAGKLFSTLTYVDCLGSAAY